MPTAAPVFDLLYGVQAIPPVEYHANPGTRSPHGWPVVFQFDPSLPLNVIECRAGGVVLSRVTW